MNRKLFKMTMAAFAATVAFATVSVPAEAMSLKQVNSEITSVQKKIKSDRRKYGKAQASDASTRASQTTIEGTRYTSDPDPLIIFDQPNNRYFHLTSLDGLTVTQEGKQIKVNGQLDVNFNKTYKWSGIECYEASPARPAHAVSDLDAKIAKEQSRVQLLKNSKKEALTFTDAPYSMIPGEKLKLPYTLKYDTDKINKITWTSSSNKVATVSKNGTVTAKKSGTATIKAKLSVTGKVYKATVNVTMQ